MDEKLEMVQLMCPNLIFYGNQLEPVFRKPSDSLVLMAESKAEEKAVSLSENGRGSTWRPQGDSTLPSLEASRPEGAAFQGKLRVPGRVPFFSSAFSLTRWLVDSLAQFFLASPRGFEPLSPP